MIIAVVAIYLGLVIVVGTLGIGCFAIPQKITLSQAEPLAL